MSAAQFKAGRSKKKRAAPLSGQPEKSTILGDSDRRPQTRGWAKAEAERKQQDKRVLRPRKPQQQAKAAVIATGSRRASSGPARAKSAVKGGTGASRVTRKGPRKSDPKRPEQGESRLTIKDLYPARNRNSAVSEWLRLVQASVVSRETSVEQENNLAVSSSEPEIESVRSTSATSRPSLAESDAGDGRPRKLNWDKLRSRNVDEEPSNDERLSHYQGLLDLKLTKLETLQAKEVQAIFKRFAQLRVEEIDYSRVESVSNEFDQWKSKVGLTRISEKHFLGDIKRCSFSNEAIIQRTIMIEIIDRHQLHDILTFNSEGQWKQMSSGCLISKNCDSVTLPKPDLNISFKLESFDKSAPIPDRFRYSLRPDSDDKRYGHCFPFLFFEVKKIHHNLEVALMANLHSASQALLNIYAWMVNTEQAEAFFEKVRVFSFIFNAQDLSVRMHRASRHPSTLLQYHFTEIADLRRYSRDEACLLVRKILETYAITELHPILKSAFDTVTAKHEEEVQRKRTANLEQKATKRPRNRRTPSIPVEMTSSSGLSTLPT